MNAWRLDKFIAYAKAHHLHQSAANPHAPPNNMHGTTWPGNQESSRHKTLRAFGWITASMCFRCPDACIQRKRQGCRVRMLRPPPTRSAIAVARGN